MLFATAVHKIGALVKHLIAYRPLRPFFGGLVIATAVWALDAYRYIGLGIPDIARSFQEPMLPWDFLGKLVFTVASLGTGFKGGEVTPLFYIGATMGNVLAPLLHMPYRAHGRHRLCCSIRGGGEHAHCYYLDGDGAVRRWHRTTGGYRLRHRLPVLRACRHLPRQRIGHSKHHRRSLTGAEVPRRDVEATKTKDPA